MDGLSLPRTETRERVIVHDHVYHLRGSEARTLATVGAFRLVPAEQLDERRGELRSALHAIELAMKPNQRRLTNSQMKIRAFLCNEILQQRVDVVSRGSVDRRP